jgi:hypothetical protein
MDGLWRMGAAIGLLRPGYLRRATQPATATERAKGPHFDEIDPQWKDVIVETFTRVSNGEALWLVAKWLTDVGLPKCSNSTNRKEWSEKNVIALIRRQIYRGVELRSETITERKLRSGRRVQRRNDHPEMREMEHLRIVPDWLWFKANKAIDNRQRKRDRARGASHPLAGIPRDSRGPLARCFVCFCGAKMYGDGRQEGGYRCSAAKQGLCWNKATTLRSTKSRLPPSWTCWQSESINFWKFVLPSRSLSLIPVDRALKSLVNRSWHALKNAQASCSRVIARQAASLRG